LTKCLNIGFDAKRLFNNTTGLGNYSRTLVSNLQKHFPQNSYSLFSPKIKPNYFNRSFINNSSLNIITAKTYFKNYWRSIGISKALITNNIQIYHGLSNELPLNIKKQTTKGVLTVHDLIFEKLPHTYPLLDRLIYRSKLKTSCKNADQIIAISQSTKQNIVDLYNIAPHKIEVVYQSCDEVFFNDENTLAALQKFQQLNLPKNYLLYVGSITPRKNLKTLLEALAILKPANQLPLVIVGKGKQYQQQMQQLSHKLKISHLLFWLDAVDSNQLLKQLYKNAAALIYPSIYEGFGLPVVEALLCQTPVITGNNSSLKEAGGPTAYYVNVLSKAALKTGIETVLENSELNNKMRKSGYQYAQKKFNSLTTSQSVIKVYEKMLST